MIRCKHRFGGLHYEPGKILTLKQRRQTLQVIDIGGRSAGLARSNATNVVDRNDQMSKMMRKPNMDAKTSDLEIRHRGWLSRDHNTMLVSVGGFFVEFRGRQLGSLGIMSTMQIMWTVGGRQCSNRRLRTPV
jgi:hypothetical protein